MTNHLTQPQETLLRQYFSEGLILQGFQTAKNRDFSPFLPHFLHILDPLSPSHITKKTQKSLCLLRFRASLFFPIKTGFPVSLFFSFLDNYSIKKCATEVLPVTN